MKKILAASVAVLAMSQVAMAADTIVAPEPEAVEYVRVCDAYGKGYFYIPGTETCLRFAGYVRYDVSGGDNAYARVPSTRDMDTYAQLTRFTFRSFTGTETELGTLKTVTEVRYQWYNGADSSSSGSLRLGFIELGGLRVGLDQSAFVTFTDYLGNVLNDDVILAGGYRTNLISYTYKNKEGFSATLSLEQGGNTDADVDVTIDDYMPHVVGGLKYAQSWGSIAGVAAYDARNEEWAGKVKVDLKLNDKFSVWSQFAYKSNDDHYKANANGEVYRMVDSFYGTWGGDWALWGGLAYQATEKAKLNLQVGYDASETLMATGNVSYALVPGFNITPELTYVQWKNKRIALDGEDAFGLKVRFQRSF